LLTSEVGQVAFGGENREDGHEGKGGFMSGVGKRKKK
jgi:hypothetical protein